MNRIIGLTLILILFKLSYGISLDELIDILKKKNPDLNKQRIELKISELEKSKANRKRLGRLDFFTTYNRYEDKRILYPISPPINPKDLVGSENQVIVGLKYTIPLFTGFKLEKNVDMKELTQNLTKTKYLLTKNQLIFNLRVLYLKTLSLEKTRNALDSYKQSLEKLYTDINEMVKLGKKPEVDLLKVNYELEKIKAKIEEVDNSIKNLKASIKELVGDYNLDLSNMEDVNFSKINYKNINIENLDKLKMENLKLKISDLKIDIAKGDYYPNIYFNGVLQRNIGNGEYKDLWQIGLNLNYTIFDWGIRSKNILSKFLEKKKVLEEKRKVYLDLKYKIDEALNNIQTETAKIRAYKNKLEYSKEVEDIEKNKYIEGVSTLYDYLKAKSQKYLTESEYYTAIYNREIQISYLKYLLEEFKGE